jgi:hypothetical protein
MNSCDANSARVFVLAILAMTWHVGAVEARPRRIWTYEALLSESKVVCLASIKSTTKIDNKDFLPEWLDSYESELTIKAVLKGDPQLKRARFIHYRYKPGVDELGNGPSFAVLRDQSKKAEGKEADAGKPETDLDPTLTFLFFLRDREGGAYGPMSGDDDAHLSVARVEGYADEE